MKFKIYLMITAFFLLTSPVFANSELVITEVHPNPLGEDKIGEFIEIFNTSDESINITDYNIEDIPIKFFGDENFILNNNEFVIIHDDEIDLKTRFPGDYKRAIVKTLTTSGLSNTGDKVILGKTGTTSEIIDTFEYIQSTEGVSWVKPLIDCSFISKSKIISDLASPNLDKTSIGFFENIFDFEELAVSLVFAEDSAETLWTHSTNYNQIANLKFKLSASTICAISETDFNYEVDSKISILEPLNNISFDGINLIEKDLVLIHSLSNSKKLFKLRVDNRIIAVPTPVQTPEATPTIYPTPVPSPTLPIPDNNFDTYMNIEINEVYPSPNTGEKEWIELYNNGTTDINLLNFKLKDLSTSQTLESTVLKNHGYIVIEVPELNISLNNSGDEIYLLNPAGQIISTFKYASTAKGISQISVGNQIKSTTIPTPGTANIYKAQVEKSTTDTETNKGKTEKTETKIIYRDIRISEIYPSPNKGEEEWLKIHNFGTQIIQLNDWLLADKSTKQKLDGIKLEPNSIFQLKGEQLKITLNNTGDEISIIDPTSKVVSTLIYPVIPKGQSYLFKDNQYLIQQQDTTIQVQTESELKGDSTVYTLDSIEEISQPQRIVTKPQIKANFKSPLSHKPAEEEIKPNDNLQQTSNSTSKIKIFKDTGLLIASFTGFVSTPYGKEFILYALKRIGQYLS